MLDLVAELVNLGVWQPLSGIEPLVERTLARQPAFAKEGLTVLHNDVYPGNIGLPYDLGGDAALVDWEMTGWGMAELDLAFMFMQPYRSARQIDRKKAPSCPCCYQ